MFFFSSTHALDMKDPTTKHSKNSHNRIKSYPPMKSTYLKARRDCIISNENIFIQVFSVSQSTLSTFYIMCSLSVNTSTKAKSRVPVSLCHDFIMQRKKNQWDLSEENISQKHIKEYQFIALHKSKWISTFPIEAHEILFWTKNAAHRSIQINGDWKIRNVIKFIRCTNICDDDTYILIYDLILLAFEWVHLNAWTLK